MNRGRTGLAIGAVSLVLAGGAAAYLLLRDAVYRTGVGGFERVVLEDDSAIELNTDTEVRVRLGWTMRKVELVRGEASFRAQPDARRPFIVIVGSYALRAPSGRFSVRCFPRKLTVLVVQGSIAVGTTSDLLRSSKAIPRSIPAVSANQAAIFGRDGLHIDQVTPDAIERRLAWKEGLVVFENATIAEAVAELNRYNPQQLHLQGESFGELRISGRFAVPGTEGFIEALERSFDVKAVRSGDAILLTRQSRI